MATLLIVTIALPMAGALAMWPAAALHRGAARALALAVSLLTLVLACGLAWAFPEHGGSFAAWEGPALASVLEIRFHVGLDGLSIWMFVLSALLTVTSVLVSWDSVDDREPLFYAMLLLLEGGCLGVFAALDVVLFYVFFEFTLIPLFFLIGIWGSEDRRYASIKFFLYTLAGSVLTFLGLLTIVIWAQSRNGGPLQFSIPHLTATLAEHPLPMAAQAWIFWGLFAGFAIKVPLFPLHTWLPLAHVQAPTAGSVFLAGILLKIGAYGFLRFSLPMLPEASAAYAPWLVWLSVAGIIYGALVALAQGDIKRLIAYSSVSHLGYCVLGLFALNLISIQGGALQMINHGISTGALFALVGMIYRRRHTRRIQDLRGLASSMPVFAFFFVLFTFSSIGLPGLNGFVGEFMVLLGTFQSGWSHADSAWGMAIKWAAILALSGMVLGAWYMLWLVERVIFGPPSGDVGSPSPEQVADRPSAGSRSFTSSAEDRVGHSPTLSESADLNRREIAALIPLAVLAFWIGLYPQFFLKRMDQDLRSATAAARQAAASAPLSPPPRLTAWITPPSTQESP